MEFTFSLFPDISLKLAPVARHAADYPTSQLQKGLVLIAGDQELAEEGVGFGVPVLKFGLKTIFPGAIQVDECRLGQEITAVYRMNLVERLANQNLQRVQNQWLYRVKDRLADAYRHLPATRRALTGLSSWLRSGFGWQTVYEYAGWDYPVKVHYSFNRQAGFLSVKVDTSELTRQGLTEVVVMNEQGAHHFDEYTDSNGVRLHGEAIGGWDEVTAERASFHCRSHKLAFSLQQVEAARLFRGRELVGTRLAWAGFGYICSPISQHFAYTLEVERLP